MSFPWKTVLPPIHDARWSGVGKTVIEVAQKCDTGKAAFDECCVAREQLESVIQAIGYDMNVYIFGGLAILGIFEVGGDVDFVGISDVEPGLDEAAEIVLRTSRELRHLGLKTRALPKARVPVIKADRVSRSLPGSPFHNLSCDGIFQFSRQVNSSEVLSFEQRLVDHFAAEDVEWNSSFQFATVQFSSTSALMYALSHVKNHLGIDIPLRLPVDVRYGPEIYRFPFDFSLSSTGLRNSNLLSRTLEGYPYSRHLLLALKKWGRNSGVINSIDGLLASYGLTVMVVHYLIKVGVLSKISSSAIEGVPQVVEMVPEYRPLASGAKADLNQIGYLLAGFLEYYGRIFDYNNSVVCTTNTHLTKKAMNWDNRTNTTNRPPFFEFAIKDPYGLDSIGRNLDADSTIYVQRAHAMGLAQLLRDVDDPSYAMDRLLEAPPKPQRNTRSLFERGIHSDVMTPDQLEARHMLSKMEFHERKKDMESFGKRAAQNYENQRAASNVTKNVLGWIRSDENMTP